MENNECNFLDIFKKNEATHNKSARAGEMFLLKLYNAKETCVSLDNLRFSSYMQMMKKTKKGNPHPLHYLNLKVHQPQVQLQNIMHSGPTLLCRNGSAIRYRALTGVWNIRDALFDIWGGGGGG